jgi:hypothetical protein
MLAGAALPICLPGNMRITTFYPGFLTANRNVPAGGAVATTRGFGKTRNLPLI